MYLFIILAISLRCIVSDYVYGGSISNGETWTDAEYQCNILFNTHLASIHSAEDNDAVQAICEEHVTVNKICIIGLIAWNGVWTWEDGSDVDYEYWRTGTGSDTETGYCTWMNVNIGGSWNDVKCIRSFTNGIHFVCNAPITDTSEGDSLVLTVSEKRNILDQHNYYRSQTALGKQTGYNDARLPSGFDMNKLLWDNGLEELATEVASSCDYSHSTSDERNSFLRNNNEKSFTLSSSYYIGENAGYFFPVYEDGDTRPVIDGSAWVDGFAAESENWSKSSGFGQTGECKQSICGHFTQVINALTRYVACGFYYCPNGITENGQIISSTSGGVYKGVCNYMVGHHQTHMYDGNSFSGNTPSYEQRIYGISYSCGYDRTFNAATGLCEGGVCSTYYTSTFKTGMGSTKIGCANADTCDDGTGRDIC